MKNNVASFIIAVLIVGILVVEFFTPYADSISTGKEKQSTWYFGEGLKSGDSFEYRICDHLLAIPASPDHCYAIILQVVALLPISQGSMWVVSAHVDHSVRTTDFILLVSDSSFKITTDGTSIPYADSLERTLEWIMNFASTHEPQPLVIGKSWGIVASDTAPETEYQCESRACQHTLVHRGFEPWPRTYEYGSGSTVYNATQNDIGKHLIVYKIELFNLGRLIHKDENKTQPLVVTYDPVYERYPYLVLKDEYWWSWGNRQGVALEYKGSYGGGLDDPTGLNQDRRSKINRYFASGFALNPINTRILSQTFSWNSASPVHISPEKQCQNATTNPAAFEVKKHNTAMFVKAGFGKISFDWPITGMMLQKRYVNATIDNTIQSASFAGFGIKNLTEYQYTYPNVKFNNPVKILTYHSDGSRTDYPVSFRMVPDVSRGAEYTQDYVCKKLLHDNYEKEIANIILDDMYDRKNEANGTGLINIKTQLTSTWFPQFYRIITNDTLDLDINEGYAALSPFEITMTVGEKTRTVSRIVNFLSPFIHVANLDQDNVLNVTNTLGFVRIAPDPRFGDIVKITINGDELREDCTDGCTTTIADKDLQIEAWNLWGGHATIHLEKFQNSPQKEINWQISYIGIVVMVIGFIVWKFGSQIIKHITNQI